MSPEKKLRRILTHAPDSEKKDEILIWIDLLYRDCAPKKSDCNILRLFQRPCANDTPRPAPVYGSHFGRYRIAMVAASCLLFAGVLLTVKVDSGQQVAKKTATQPEKKIKKQPVKHRPNLREQISHVNVDTYYKVLTANGGMPPGTKPLVWVRPSKRATGHYRTRPDNNPCNNLIADRKICG